MVASRCGSYLSFEEVTNSDFRNIMAVRIKYSSDTLRVIVLHAPQETDSVEERVEFFDELTAQVERGLTAGDKLVIVGDFNARISPDNDPNNLSPNGKLTSDLLDDCELEVGNFSPETNGMWTRIQSRYDGSVCKSVIDYVLLPAELMPLMSSLLIDEEKIYCPYRVRNSKKKKVITRRQTIAH